MLQCLLLAVFWLDVAGRPKHRNQYHPHSMNHIQKNIHQRQTKPPQMHQKVMSGTKDQVDILSQTSTKVMDLYNDRGYQAYLVNANFNKSERDSFDAYLSSEFDICFQQLKHNQIKTMLRKRHFLHIRSHNWLSNNVETSTPNFISPTVGTIGNTTPQGVISSGNDCTSQMFPTTTNEYKMRCQILGIYNEKVISDDGSDWSQVPYNLNSDNLTEVAETISSITPLFGMEGDIDAVYKEIQECNTKKRLVNPKSMGTTRSVEINGNIERHVKILKMAHKKFKKLKEDKCLHWIIKMMRITGKAMRDPEMNCRRLDKINKRDCIEHIANYVNSSMINDLDKMAGCVNSTLSMINSISTEIKYNSADVDNGITELANANTSICKILMAFYLSGFQIYKLNCSHRPPADFMSRFRKITDNQCRDERYILTFLRNQKSCRDKNVIVT